MELLQLILRKLVGPVISRTIPAVRSARARFSRGRCFAIPKGKTYILLPEELDYESASQISAMLERFWYESARDWEVVRTGPGVPLHQDIRHANLICLGGPDQNPFVGELMRDHPELLRSVRYHGDGSSSEFRWQDQVFRADPSRDFALVAVRRNPLASEPHSRLVLIFGLGDAGTLAGAAFFADHRYSRERRKLQREAGTLQGGFEALLQVSCDAERGHVLHLRPASRADGAAAQLSAPANQGERRPFSAVEASLALIYDSLEQHRRRVVQSDLRFTLTVTRDFSLRFQEEVTIGAETQDIVVFTKKLRGTPLGADENIAFSAELIDGDDDDLVYLPAEVLPSERRFLMFPLPALIAGHPPRRIRLSALWPRACSSLEQPLGEDVNSVEVTEHAGPDVDRVTVTIRFDVPDAKFHVFPRFPHSNALAGAGSDGRTLPRRRTYGIDAPYSIALADVPRGTVLEFRIVRVTGPGGVRLDLR